MKNIILTKGNIMGILNYSLSAILQRSIGNAVHITQDAGYITIQRCPNDLATKLLNTIGGEKEEGLGHVCSWYCLGDHLIEVVSETNKWIEQ